MVDEISKLLIHCGLENIDISKIQIPKKVYSRDSLLRNIWGTDVHVVPRTVDVHIRKIREKIGDHYINTIKGVGYKFIDYDSL